jgi:hypothetical protein
MIAMLGCFSASSAAGKPTRLPHGQPSRGEGMSVTDASFVQKWDSEPA